MKKMLYAAFWAVLMFGVAQTAIARNAYGMGINPTGKKSTNITQAPSKQTSTSVESELVTATFYSQGSGTENDPYRITSVADLQALSTEVNTGHDQEGVYFRLTADVDMSAVANFTPIGNTAHPFSGYFDGDRHTILNLKINLPDKDTVGLFGYVYNDANVNNLNLMAANITGRNYVGGIIGVGYNNVTASTNTVSGTINGSDYVGGVVGSANNQIRIVENTCVANITSTGEYAGGIAGGLSHYAVCSFNVFAGRLIASQTAGGIVGRLFSAQQGHTSTMAANFSEGSFTPLTGSSPSQIGAVVGETDGPGLTLKNNFYDKQMWSGLYGLGGASSDVDEQIMGKLTSEALGEGLLVYDAVEELRFSTNHYIFSEGRYPRIKNSPNDDIVLAAAAPVKLQANSSTDFETIDMIKSAFTVNLEGVVWKSADTTVFEVGYYGTAPLRADTGTVLYAVVNNVPVRHIPLHFASEEEGFHKYGTKPNPIMINSKSELESLRDATNNKAKFKGVSGSDGFADQYFIQTTDIAYINEWNPIENVWMAVEAWKTSIGCDASHPFKGNYDGQNHRITNFVVFADGSSSSTTTYPLADYRGLFGYMKDASVENLHLSGGIYARNYVGLMAGYANNTRFSNCSLVATTGKSQNQVKASASYAGGLLGKGFHVTIENCNNNANIQAASILGGVVGSVTDTSHISFSHNTGTVTSTSGESTAGVVGVLGDGVGFCTIDNCNNSGAVNGYSYVAGIVAKVNPGSDANDRNGAVRHCNNTAPIKGNTYVGGIIGLGKAVAVEHCSMSDTTVNAMSNYVGGIAGWLTYNPKVDANYPDTAFSTLNHCSSAAQITTEQSYAGGIAGLAEYVKDIHDLSNEGTSIATKTGTSGYFGGFFGSTNRLNLKNLTNKATVTASTNYNGGIIGLGDIWTIVDSCHNEADITGKANTGGLVGRTEGYTSITNSDNEGTVTGLGGDYIGGVVGYLYGITKSGYKGFYAANLANNGTVSGVSNHVGGVIGRLDGNGRFNNKVQNLKNYGSVTGNSYVGGVFGSAVRYVYLDTLENRGEVTNTLGNYTGGIGGAMGNTDGCFDTLKHAKNYGAVNGMGYVAGVVAAVSDGDNVNLRGELIDSCENHGSITAKGNYAGGLIAATCGSTVRNSYNDGPLTSTAGYLGGLIGSASRTYRVNATYTDTVYCVLDNLVNDADMESNDSYTGGAVGSAKYCDIRNLTNNGKVIGMDYTGGLLGYCTLPVQPLSKENCHIGSNVTVQGRSTVGGLVGAFYYGAIRDYENHTKVVSDDKNGLAGDNVGGVAGFAGAQVLNGDTIPVKFINVKNHGDVYAPATSGKYNYGGVLGKNDFFLLMDSCYNDAAVEGNCRVGGILGVQESGFSKILHSDNSGNVISNASGYVGGIVGTLGYAKGYDTIMCCNNYGDVYSTFANAGGIVGVVGEVDNSTNRRSLIDSCVNMAAVTGSSNVGGIVGFARAMTISRCCNKATIEGTTGGYVGGIAGDMLRNTKVSGTVTDTCVAVMVNCTNEASVTGHGSYTGGVVGYCYPYTQLENIKNSGGVLGKDYTGGVVGFCGSYTNMVTMENSGDVTGVSYVGGFIGQGSCVDMVGLTNTVTVTATGDNVGGVIGYLTGYMKRDSTIIDPVSLKDCHNKGEINAEARSIVGGVAGKVLLCGVAENCTNEAEVRGGSYVGGLFGAIRAVDTIRNMTNTGKITATSEVVGGVVGQVYSYLSDNVQVSLADFYQNGSWFHPNCPFYVENLKSNAEIVANGGSIGGVVGRIEGYGAIGGQVKNLTLQGGNITGASTVGGVIGSAHNNVMLCELTHEAGDVITTGDNPSCLGGVIATLYSDCKLSKAYNNGGTVKQKSKPVNTGYTGGIVGYAYTNVAIDSVYNKANVSIFTATVGGVVGYLGSTSALSQATNSGDVSGTSQVAGVVGYLQYANVFGVLNTGRVSGTSSQIGGIVGWVTNGETAAKANDTTGIVRYALNAGVVSGTTWVAGIVGSGNHAFSFPIIDNVVNVGDVVTIYYTGLSPNGTSTTYNVAIYGNRNNSTYSNETKVMAAYFDRQMCTSPYAIGQVGTRNPEASLFTSQMLGSALNGALDADNWHFADGRYPIPKGLENTSAAMIASLPIFLRDEGDANYENVSLVQTDFTVTTDARVNYSNNPADAVALSPDGTATIGDLNQYFNLIDTLTLTCNGETRDVLLRMTGDSALTVDNLQDLRNLRDAVNNGSGTYKGHFSDNGFKDVAFIMTANIDMSEEACWMPIGRYKDGTVVNDRPFRGIFHGNNHIISNLKAEYPNADNISNYYIGLFGYVYGGGIDSLHFDNTCVVKGFDAVGTVVGYAGGSAIISACSSSADVKRYSSSYGCGGIVGRLNHSIVDGCLFSGHLSGGYSLGGIVGVAVNSAEVKNSINKGTADVYMYTGGIVGQLTENSLVVSCQNEADFSTGGLCHNGGVVGLVSNYSKVLYCTNKGNLKYNTYNVGGIVGTVNNKSTVLACVNLGLVSSTSNDGCVGGIVGVAHTGSTVDACVNFGAVNGTTFVGGVVGKLYSADTIYQTSMVHSLNAGPVTGNSNTGGVVGFVSANFPVEVSNNINNALISAQSNQGAIVGSLEYPEQYDCSHNFSDKQLCFAKAIIGSEDSLWAQNQKFTLQMTGESLHDAEGLDDGWTFEEQMYPRPTLLKDNAVAIVAATPLFMDSTSNTAAGYENLNRIDTLAGLGTAHEVVWTGSANMNIVGDTAYVVYGECRTDTAKLTVSLDGISRTFNLNFGDIGNDWSRLTIDNMADLKAFQHAVNYGGSYKCVNNVDGFADKHFELTFDPDLAADDETKDFWEPIGWRYNDNYLSPFKGYFHGGGHTIRHLNVPNVVINCSKYVERTDAWNTRDNRGFFGYLINATIDSLNVQGTVLGSSYLGLVAGRAYSSSISYCETFSSSEDTSYVWSNGNLYGGVVGYVSASVLTSNTNRADLSGPGYAGGVVGKAESNCRIDTCRNYGSVTSTANYVGGICGSAETGVAITSCMNVAKISSLGSYVGGISGLTSVSSPVTGCFNTGNVLGAGHVGGISGRHLSSDVNPHDITNCVNTGNISGGKRYVGGIVGSLNDGNYNLNKPPYVKDVVNYGYVNGEQNVGGIVGANEFGALKNCISVGASNPLSYGGGIAGSYRNTYQEMNISNCYYDAQMSGSKCAVLSDETALPEAKRKTLQLLSDSIIRIDTTFSEELWVFSEDRYPRLKLCQDSTAVLVASTPVFLYDTETVRRVYTFPFTVANLDEITYTSSHPEYVYVEGNEVKQGALPNDTLMVVTLTGSKNGYVHTAPFLIGNLGVLTIDSLSDLVAFRDAVNNGTTYKGISGEGGFSGLYVVLTTNIDMSAVCSAESGESWTPIGNSATSFKGAFLGKGHHIDNLYINKTADTDNDQFNYQGLFGCVSDGGCIDSLHVFGNVTGRQYVGGIVASMNNRTVLSNCSYEGSVTGRSNRTTVGGLAGELLYSSFIVNCQANAVVNGGSSVGGLTGTCYYGSSIEHSENRGDVVAVSENAGGLAGTVQNNSTIKYSQNAGMVSAPQDLGGLIGEISSFGCTVMYCCNIGAVVANAETSARIGGLLGANTLDQSRLVFCYNLNAGPVVGQTKTSDIGGIMGYSSRHYSGGKEDNNINVANVRAYSSTAGGCIGRWVTAFDEYYNIFNRQYCPFPTIGNMPSSDVRAQGDRFTSEILGTGLRDAGVEGFTDEDWVFAEGMYPRPKGIDTTTIAKLAATPIYLYENGSLSDYSNSVRKNFAITTNADGLAVSYTSAKGLQFEGDSAKLNALTGDQVLHDTLTMSANGIQRFVLLDLYPSEIAREYQLTIDSLQDLVNFRDAVNNCGTYKGFSAAGGFSGNTILVTTDIDMSPICGSSTGSWTPIGTMENSFKGVLNGNNKKISNLYINNTSTTYQGLFGVVNACHIDSLHVVNANVTGKDYVGALVGLLQNRAQVSYCSVAGKVTNNTTATASYIGGVCGRLYSASIIDHTVNYASVTGVTERVGGICGDAYQSGPIIACRNAGSVEGQKQYTGGICGYSEQSDAICQCQNSGVVKGPTNTGGICGYAYMGTDIVDCENEATVEGTSNIGGVLGYANRSKVKNCINKDTVLCKQWTVDSWNHDVVIGGVVARAQYGSVVDSCESTEDAFVSSVGNYVGGVVGIASYETKVAHCINRGEVYGARGNVVGGVIASLSGGGSNNTATWKNSSMTLCENYGLVKGNGDIMGGVVGSLQGSVRTYTVEGIQYYDTTWVHIDSCRNEGVVTNGVETNIVCNSTGGVAGYVAIHTDTLKHCVNAADVISLGNYVGGVVGNAANITSLSHCVNSGNVTAQKNHVGGIAGYATYNSSLSNCVNTGNVTSQGDNVGGVAGYATTNSPLAHCDNSASVTSQGSYVGGVAGRAETNSPLSHCDNTGNVIGRGSNGCVGGVAGLVYAFSNVDSCQNHGSVFAVYNYLGGVVGEAQYACSVTNCDNYGMLADTAIGSLNAPTNRLYTGGIAGGVYSQYGNDPRYRTVRFENNHNHTDQILNYRSNFAGVVGRIEGSNWSRNVTEDGVTVTKVDTFLVQLKNCTNSGRVKSLAGSNVGGVVGYANYVDTMAHLVNTGDSVLSASSNSGGVLGAADRIYNVDSLVNHAEVKNISLTNCSYMGGVAGYFASNDAAHRLTLSNLYNEGNVTGPSNYAGGCVGYVDGYATMEHLTNKGDVSALGTNTYDVGGVIGWMAQNAGYDTLRYAFNYGNVRAAINYRTGGIVGNVNGRYDGYLNTTNHVRCRETLIDSCINYGNVSGMSEVAGIVGGMNATTLTRAYNLADSVRGTSSNVGGVIGYAAPNQNVNTSASYNITDTAHSYINDVHNEAAVYSTGGTYHGGVIGQFNDYQTVMENATNKANVTGISQVGGIAGYVLADTLRNCFTQGNVTATGNYAGGQVGYVSRKAVNSINYPTVFDNVLCQDVPSYKNNHLLTAPLMLSSASSSNKPQLRDTVQGTSYVGGAIGYAIQHTRKNYVNLNTVIATGSYVGGYAGRIENASLLDSIVNYASVTTQGNDVGGIVGEFFGVNNSLDNWSYLHRCLNRGAITGVHYVGGIAGVQNSANIDTCVNYGNVIGSGDYTGGIVGTMWTSNKPSRLAYCLNVGSVENFNINAGNRVGGIVGSMENNAANVMEYVINNAVVRGINNVGGVVGYRNASDTLRYALNVGHLTTKLEDTDPNDPRKANASGLFGGSASNDARVYDNYFDWQMSAENEASNAKSTLWPEAKKSTRQLVADSLRTGENGAGWTDENFVFTENRYPQLKVFAEWKATKTMSKLAASPIYLQAVDANHDNVEQVGNDLEQHYMHLLNDGNYWEHITSNKYSEFECRVEQHDMPGVIDSTEILCQFTKMQILIMRDTLEDEELFVNLWLGRNPETTRINYDTVCYSSLPVTYGDITFERADFDTIKTYSGEVMKYHFYNCDSVIVYFVECQGIHTYTDSITLCANKEYKTSWWLDGGATIIPGGDMPAGNGGSGHTYNYDYTLRKDTVFRGKDFDPSDYNKWIHYENVLVLSSTGCDSITDFYLYVHPSYAINESIEVCKEAFPFKYAGATFQEPYSGWATDAAIPTAECGCDSVIGLQVTAINYTDNQPYSYDTVCLGTNYVNDGWIINTADSASLQEPGTYEFHRMDLTHKKYDKVPREDIPGCIYCDSVVNLYLTLTVPTLTPKVPSLVDDTTIYYNALCQYTEVTPLGESDFTVKYPQNGSFSIEHSDTTNNAEGCEWQYKRTYIWTDECGNTSTVEHLIIVKDSTRPALASPTWADSTVYMTAYSDDCDLFTLPTAYTTVKEVNDAFGSAFITDCNINDSQPVTHTDEDVDAHSCNRYILRTYSVTDSCGNGPAVFKHKIWVKDTVKPVLKGSLKALTVYLAADCGITLPDPYTTTEELLANGLTAVKDCNSSLTVTKTDVQDNNNTCDRFYVRTYKVADACGNSSTTDQIIHVLDTAAPSFKTIGEQTALVAGNCQYQMPDLKDTTMKYVSDCNGTIFVGQDVAVGTKYDQLVEKQTIPVVVTVKDSCGNQNTYTIGVIVPAAVKVDTMMVAEISCQDNDGAIDITVSDGTAPYTYLWSNGATTQDISGLSEVGKYIVTLTDANACVAKDSADLAVMPPLQLTSGNVPNKPVACKGDSNGELYVSAIGGEKPYSFLWSTGSTSTTLTNLAAGNYTVTVTDNRSCTTQQVLTVHSPATALQLSNVSKTDAICYGAADGTVTATVSGGWTTTPYNITIGAQSTTSTGAISIEGLSAGTYTLHVADFYGCKVKQENIVIDQPTQLVNSFTCTSNCYADDDGVIMGSVSGSVAPYTLQLVGVDTKNLTAAGDYEFDSLPDGTYAMILTDDHGCEKKDTAKIQRNEKPLTVKANIHTWTYDGLEHSDTNFVVIYDGDTSSSVLSGHTYRLVNSDVVSAVVTGSITNVASTPVTNVLSGIVVTRGADTVTCEYNIISKNGTLTVTPRALAITLDTSKVYDGTEIVSECSASNHSYTVEGLQNGATVIAGTVTSSAAKVGTYTDSSATAEAVITTAFATSDGIGNYNVTYDFSQEITKASCITLTCPTGEAITKVYDALVMQPSATATTPIEGDVIKVEYKTVSTDWTETAPSLTNVGTVAVDVRATNPNYDTATCSYTLTVNQRPITVTARDTNFYYDGLAHNASQMSKPRYTIDSLDLVSGHNLVTDVTSADQTDLGSTPTIVGEVTIMDADSNDVTSNYDITPVNGTLKVEGYPQQLTISSESHQFDCYNKGQKYEHYAVKYGETTCAAVEGSDYKFVLAPVPGIHDTLTITPTCAGTTGAGALDNVKNTFTYVLQNNIQYVGTRDTVCGYLTQPDTLTLALTKDEPFCGDGSIMSLATGGNGGNKFHLSTAADTDSTTHGTYNGLSAGDYTVSVTDSKHCVATASVTLTSVDVKVKRGLTRNGQLAIYSADTLMVDRNGGRHLFPALGRTGEIIPQPKMEAFSATGSTSSITVSVKVAAVGAAPMLELEVATDANFDATTVMYTYKPASVSDGTTYSNTFTNLPSGTYYCRAKLYNCSGAVTTEVTKVVIP